MATLDTAHRVVTANFISDIISLPKWKNNNERLAVYAVLAARLSPPKHMEVLPISLATGWVIAAIGDPNLDNTQLRESVFKISKMVHTLMDEDGDWLFNEEGLLSDKWKTDHTLLATALLETLPKQLLPTIQPDLLGDYPKHREVFLIKNKSYQTRAQIPLVYKAMDILYSEAYRLNPDITSLINLEIDINIHKNYAAKLVALQNMDEFKDTFHFKYTLDSRGRSYSRSAIIQPQGASFDKAIINFATAKPLGKYGLQALMIHYANTSGHDKISFVDRMRWARTHGKLKAEAMQLCNSDWIKIKPLIENTKHAFEEYSAALEFLRATQYTHPQEYKSAIITHQDATNSGFQIGAALMKDHTTADLVNITNSKSKTDTPADIYGVLSDNLNKKLQGTKLLTHLPKIDRNFCKYPIMITGYGAGIKKVMIKIAEENPEIDETHLADLTNYVENSLQQTATSMIRLTNILRNLVNKILENTNTTRITWKTPDGFTCIQTYRNKLDRQIKLSKTQVAYINLTEGKLDPLDVDKMRTALSPNFIHSIDGQIVRTATITAHYKHISVCPIHDSFGTHASTFFSLNTILKEAFVETLNFPWYEVLCEQNKVKPQNITIGNYQIDDALKAVYMFS